jgi:hypothetical protein
MLGWSAAVAAAAPDLYQAGTRVTGQTAEGRAPAIARCLTEVLVKVSGDSRLLDDPRVAAAAKQAGALVTDVHYRDLMAGLPTNDEQGTRDRPHELTVAFHPAGVDALLRTLGRKPWTGPRPRVAIFLEVRQRTSAYTLTSDGERGATMREALEEAAARVGLPAVLPSRATQAQAGSSRERWLTADRRRLGTAARAAGGDVALVGRLVWSEAALGWIADWRLATEARTHRWRIRGVSFDDAFRSAMRGAVQVLSGHGQPKS